MIQLSNTLFALAYVGNNGDDIQTFTIDAFGVILQKQRVLLDLSGDIKDEGTNALMSDYIREQEKLVWMYSAFLK